MRQDIEGSDTKNSAKGKVEQIEGTNNHSANTTRTLILEKAFTTDNGGKSIDKAQIGSKSLINDDRMGRINYVLTNHFYNIIIKNCQVIPISPVILGSLKNGDHLK